MVLLCGIVDAGTYELAMFVPTTTHHTQQHTGNAAKVVFFDLWPLHSTMITLLAVWDASFAFFSWFDDTHNND